MSKNNVDSATNLCEVDGSKITANNFTIKGGYNIIHGNNNIVIGDYNEVHGNGNNIYGNFNKFEGKDVRENGNANAHVNKTSKGSSITYHKKVVTTGNTVSHFGPVYSGDGQVRLNCGPVGTREKQSEAEDWRKAKGGRVLGPIKKESASPSGSNTSISINKLVLMGNTTMTMTDDRGNTVVYAANKK